MRISEISIARPVLATMAISSLVVFGLVSYRLINVSLLPDVDFPIVTITVFYEGADPETVETEVTDVIEEAVNTISGIKSLRSESTEDVAQIFVEFELEHDINVASQDVRDRVASIRADLPLGVDPPVIEKFDPDSTPILAIVLSAPASIRQVSDYAEDVLKPRIEGIAGVGNVRLVGSREREIRVWLRVDDLHAYSLSAEDVINALDRENVEFPGGRVETGRRELIVKTKGKVQRVEQFKDLIIVHRGGVPVRLRDVAWVEDGLEDFRSLARLNGQRAVSLLVRRQSGANILAVASGVKNELASLEGELPAGYGLILAQDLSRFVEDSFSEAQGELLRGGFLAVAVIFMFLRSLRGSFVAAVTIPTTIIATYSFMLAMGFTLNMMSMLALTISVGMIIDDSIVVIENSYRHLEAGRSRMEAARAGIAEIGFAVIATSLAIAAVFIPVAFMKGLVGRFFYEFGLTVTFAVVISTLIAVTLSPMLCSRLLQVSTRHGRLFNALEAAFTSVETFYRRSLKFALGHRWLVLLSAIGLFLCSLLMVPFIGKEFVPSPDEAQFNIQVETPTGSSIQQTSRVVEEIERRIRRIQGVTVTFTTIGAGVEGRVNVATMLVRLTDKSLRDADQEAIMAEARRRLRDLTHLKISVELIPRVAGGGFRAAPLQYNLRGNSLPQLAELSRKITDEVRNVPGIVDVNSTYETGKPEVEVEIDRDKAADLGISVEDLGKAIRGLVGGRKVTTFEEDGDTFDVRVRLMAGDRDRPDEIGVVPVRGREGQLIEVRNIASIRETTGPVQIDRQDRNRQVTIMANLERSKPLAEAMDDLLAIESRIGLEAGITSSFTGFGDMMAESFANMGFSLALAIVLIYMVLAAQFESFLHPFTVMFSLPLSVVGALGGLALTGRTLNIYSMIGMIMLTGLVTKNAILLVDYTNNLRRRGYGRDEAILEAAPVRLRPILMTALSTIAGMMPVAIGLGAGSESRAPMGTCIVGGMISSTLLTLIVIPVMYSVMDDTAARFRKVFSGVLGQEVIASTTADPCPSENGAPLKTPKLVRDHDG